MTAREHVLGSGAVVHHWRPTDPVATAVLQHGFGEYAERYVEQHAQLVPRLLEAGFEVWALDLWGHGDSPGRRGVTSVRRAVLDHREVRLLAAGSGLPVLLVGHSLGGLVTAASAARDGAGLAGVVLLAPALERPAPRLVRGLLGAAATVAPGLPIPRRRRPLAELSTDPAVGPRARTDPLMYAGQVSLLLAATALDEASCVWSALASWRVPTLVLHGTDDTYTDPRASRDFVRLLGPAGDLRLVEGGRHELLNDLAGTANCDLVLSWLIDHQRVHV